MNRSTALAPALWLALSACGGSEPPPAPETPKVTLATGSGGGYAVELLAGASTLPVGLDALWLRVRTAGGTAVTDASVQFLPLMDAMGHRCPVIGPGAAGGDGLYRFHAVFQMAGAWSAEVKVTRGGVTGVVPLGGLTVVTGKDLARTFQSGGSGYVMALEFQAAPKVGLNPVVVTLHETQDAGATFAPVNDAALVLDPQMPSMGHGSPGSVNPALVGDGWYEGQLSFSMPGDWETTITASRGGTAVGAPKFVIWF